MKAYKCDRCGKLFEVQSPATVTLADPFIRFAEILIKSEKQLQAEELASKLDVFLSINDIDLCPECVESLTEWFKGNK